MIYVVSLVLALGTAIVRGGRLSNASLVSLRWGWLILAAFGLQLAVVYLPQLQTAGRYQWPAYVIVLSYVMLLVGAFANRQIGGIKLLGVGLLLNFIVIAANGGFMPIAPEVAADMGLLPLGVDLEPGMRLARSKDIILEPSQTTLWILSDVFATSQYLPFKHVFSIGDAFGAVGLFLAIQAALLPGRGTEQQGLAKAACKLT